MSSVSFFAAAPPAETGSAAAGRMSGSGALRAPLDQAESEVAVVAVRVLEAAVVAVVVAAGVADTSPRGVEIRRRRFLLSGRKRKAKRRRRRRSC